MKKHTQQKKCTVAKKETKLRAFKSVTNLGYAIQKQKHKQSLNNFCRNYTQKRRYTNTSINKYFFCKQQNYTNLIKYSRYILIS